MLQRRRLNRKAYAEARAQGMTMHDAARAAGSKATSDPVLCEAARTIEFEPGFQAYLSKVRDRVVTSIQDDFRAACMRARQCLDDPKLKRFWPEAWRFFARVGGHFKPAEVALNVQGEVRHVHDHTLSIDGAWLQKLLARAREDGLEGYLGGDVKVVEAQALPSGNGSEAK